MASIITLIFFMFLLFFSIAEGDHKKIGKIIIHVPYKIHKHHHTHTKYKLITVPAPKKENTVIYLKEEIHPLIKHVPVVQSETKLADIPPKTPESFIPPHQQSASELLDSIANHKKTNIMPTDHQQHYRTIMADQKPLESHSDQNTKSLVPHFMFKPILLPPQENFIPNYSFKATSSPQHNVITQKLLLNPIMHQSYEALLPKFTYQPILHLPQGQLNSKFTYNHMTTFPKVLHDSIHTSSQIYKTMVPPKSKATSYKVREENQGDQTAEIVKHQPNNLNTIPLSTVKPVRQGKSSLISGQNIQFKNKESAFQSNPDYDYEHVGYLIIDGNSRKVVGKNFKDEIHLLR